MTIRGIPQPCEAKQWRADGVFSEQVGRGWTAIGSFQAKPEGCKEMTKKEPPKTVEPKEGKKKANGKRPREGGELQNVKTIGVGSVGGGGSGYHDLNPGRSRARRG